MDFISKVKNKWEIVISSNDLFLERPTKEELIDLITSAIPKKEIISQLVRLSAHVLKTIIYERKTTSWETTIRDAILEIRESNTRDRGVGVYYSFDEMHQMFLTRWNSILSWVASESDGQWTVPELKKKVTQKTVWNAVNKLPLDKRIEISPKKKS